MAAIDLFCGVGGLSAGLRQAGWRVVHAVDRCAVAVQSYDLNFTQSALLEGLSWRSELPAADLIVGGPPCQGFSSAGRRTPEDARNSSVAVFAHLVAKHRPRAFLFENVEGFLTGDNGRWVLDLLEPLIHAGYCIHLRKVNAAHYGVPQHRKRVIALGGLGWDPGFPPITHGAAGMPGASRVGQGLPLCPSVEDALRDLPSPAARIRGRRSYSDHDYRVPRGADIDRIRALKPGQTMKDLPERLWHETYRRRAYRRVMDGTPSERRGGPPSGLRRLHGDQPAKAITSGATSEFVHPTDDRTLTLRECARIQTFPDDFRFSGTLAQKALLIGNALPPRLGEVFGLHIKKAIATNRHRTGRPGGELGLKSFVVTNADAMSPALQRTAALVQQRYMDAANRQMALFRAMSSQRALSRAVPKQNRGPD